jgi:hypothetical protein
MSHWSDNPELWDEILKKEFLRRFEPAFGEDIPEELVDYVHDMDNFYHWLEETFGWQWALDVASVAEADYWADYTDYVHTMMEDRNVGESKESRTEEEIR